MYGVGGVVTVGMGLPAGVSQGKAILVGIMHLSVIASVPRGKRVVVFGLGACGGGLKRKVQCPA